MSDMKTDAKKTTGLIQDSIAALRMKIRGDIIQPSDLQYEMARKVYNAMIDKHPALIIRPVDVADIRSAVNFGGEQGLDVAVRGGSHNGAGFGTVDGGMVIDLSRMRGIRVDPEEKTVRVEGGAVWGDVDHATYPFGLAVPCGFLSTTGVGGLTLGGGSGYLTRRYGLTIDNLLSADMVLADGRFVTASREQNEDLFWAVRGGGGNFGIVTSFLFRGNPVSTVYGGPMFWPMEAAADILPYWQNLILNAPDELYGRFGFATVPPVAPFPEKYQLQKMCAIVWCYTGPLEKADQVFKPIRSFRQPAIDFAGPIPFPALQSMFDALFPAGYQWYWQGDFVKHYDDKAINLLIEHGKELPTMFSNIHIYPINGAAGRIGPRDTAWGYRDANFSQVIVAVDPDPANNERIIRWAKDFWSALHPYSAGGAYLNFKMDEGQETVKAGYRENYTRLAQIKAKYDPNNFFHINQNILPKA
ncbi:MAG: FAD-binding oxidoreductase [Anaerolineales bacterium]